MAWAIVLPKIRTYSYTASGTYNVCVNITTDEGCTDNYCEFITVSDCAADFDYTVSQDGNFFVNFNDQSTTDFGTVTSWNWTVSNGQTSALQNPNVSLSAGAYEVCLTITTSLNCTDTFCDSLLLGNCTAAFGSTVAGLTASFENFSTTDFGTILTTVWNFGDGTGATLPNMDYTYAASGTYNVCLTITTDPGCTDTFCDDVTVSDCEADFTYAISPTAALFVNFTDQSTTDFGTVTSWSWDFGDNGLTSTAQNPSHTYAGPDSMKCV